MAGAPLEHGQGRPASRLSRDKAREKGFFVREHLRRNRMESTKKNERGAWGPRRKKTMSVAQNIRETRPGIGQFGRVCKRFFRWKTDDISWLASDEKWSGPINGASEGSENMNISARVTSDREGERKKPRGRCNRPSEWRLYHQASRSPRSCE